MYQATGSSHGKARQSAVLWAIRLNTQFLLVTTTKGVFAINSEMERLTALRVTTPLILRLRLHPTLRRLLTLRHPQTLRHLLILSQTHTRLGKPWSRSVKTHTMTPPTTTREPCTKSTANWPSSRLSSSSFSRLRRTTVSSLSDPSVKNCLIPLEFLSLKRATKSNPLTCINFTFKIYVTHFITGSDH